MEKLTERQLKVLGSIWGHIRSYGEFPSYSKLMQVLGLKSKQSIADFFEILEREGFITKRRKVSLTGKAIQYLVDREVQALGLGFVPSFDFFPVMTEKENSTVSMPLAGSSENVFVKKEDLVGEISEISGLTTTTGVESDKELSAFADYPIMGKNIGGTKTEVHIDKLANKIVVQNTNGNIINTIKEGDHTEIGSQSYKLSVIDRLCLNIKAGFDKLLELFR